MPGVAFTFMRDYIPTQLRAVLSHQKGLLLKQIDDSLAYAATRNVNSIRGTVEGEGSVTNSFILGKATVAKDAVVANCIIDDSVDLIVEEGAVVCDCSIHPSMIGNVRCPVTVHVGKNSILFNVQSAEYITMGNDSIICYTQLHEVGNSYETVQAHGVRVGNNVFIYGCYLRSYEEVAANASNAKVCIGDGSVLWLSRLVASDGILDIGPNATVCDYNYAFRVCRKGEGITNPPNANHDNGHTPLAIFLGNMQQYAQLEVCQTKLEAAGGLYIGASVTFNGAFEKIPNSKVSLGKDNVIINTAHGNSHEHAQSFNIHTLKTGDRVTFCCDGDNWYSNREPERFVEVGSDVTLLLNTNGNHFKGMDKRVPSNTRATL